MNELPFWEMQPADRLVTGAASLTTTRTGRRIKHPLGPQVFAKPGSVYVVYYPTARSTGRIELERSESKWTLRWYNPRTGHYEGSPRTLNSSGTTDIGAPPADASEDWVAVIRRG